MATDSVFSLGAALLGFPADPDPANPVPPHPTHVQPPEPWVSQHLVPALHASAATALFATCTGGRDLMLAARQHFNATLNLDEPSNAWQRSMIPAKSLIQRRGAQGSGLVFLLQDQGEDLLVQAIEDMGGVGHVIAVQLPFATSEVMSAAATAFPSLTKVDIAALLEPLPPPNALPHLTDLTLWGVQDADSDAVESIGPYLSQVSSITLNCSWEYQRHIRWDDLFDSAPVSTTLKTFTTDDSVTEDLLRLLRKHTPNVEHMSAHITERSFASAPTISAALPQCRRVTMVSRAGVPPVSSQSIFSWVGSPASGPITLEPTRPHLWFTLTPRGLDGATQAQLQSIKITPLSTIRLTLQGNSSQQEADGLRAALQHLQPACDASTEVLLMGLGVMTDELAAVVVEAQGRWPKISIVCDRNSRQLIKSPGMQQLPLHAIKFWSLDDLYFMQLVQCSAEFDLVTADSLDLQDDHSSVPWELRVDIRGSAGLLQVLLLPVAAVGPGLSIGRMNIELDDEVVVPWASESCSPSQLVTQLTQRIITSHSGISQASVRQTSVWMPPRHSAEEVRKLLAALPQLLPLLPEPKESLQLCHWVVTPDSTAALEQLPSTWQCELHIDIVFSLPQQLSAADKARMLRERFHQAGAAIPPNYSTVSLTWVPGSEHSGLTVERVRSECLLGICGGASSSRSSQQPLRVVYTSLQPQDLFKLNAQLREQGVSYHIRADNRLT